MLWCLSLQHMSGLKSKWGDTVSSELSLKVAEWDELGKWYFIQYFQKIISLKVDNQEFISLSQNNKGKHYLNRTRMGIFPGVTSCWDKSLQFLIVITRAMYTRYNYLGTLWFTIYIERTVNIILKNDWLCIWKSKIKTSRAINSSHFYGACGIFSMLLFSFCFVKFTSGKCGRWSLHWSIKSPSHKAFCPKSMMFLLQVAQLSLTTLQAGAWWVHENSWEVFYFIHALPVPTQM